MSTKVKRIGNDSNNGISVQLNTDALDQIELQLNKRFVAQVGVLGVKAAGRVVVKREAVGGPKMNRKVPVASESSLSNADIGLIHEKGSKTRNIPRRSFLEVPLTTKMPKLMQKVGAILLKGINAINIELAYQKLADIGEGQVHQAFPTGGFGLWPSKSDGEPSHLIKTAQLKDSIASRVVSR